MEAEKIEFEYEEQRISIQEIKRPTLIAKLLLQWEVALLPKNDELQTTLYIRS